MLKKMLFCGSTNVVRNGLRVRFQLYKCKDCGRKFRGGTRIEKLQVISDYVEENQTCRQLSEKYGVSARTISRYLSSMHHVQKVSKDRNVVVQMDPTYWECGFDLMVIKDALRNKVLWRKYVTHETIADYMEGVQWLKSLNIKIYGVVIDGIRGLAQALWPCPVQLCQFHQILTVRYYLTQEPELDASRDLLELVSNIAKMDKESFLKAFMEWHEKYRIS